MVLAPRGAILDNAGNKLAYDVPAFYMDVKVSTFSKNEKKLADILSKPLGISPSEVLKTIPSGYKWIQWPKPVLEPIKGQVTSAMKAASQLDAVTFTPTEVRFYPCGSFAANAIGFTGQSGVGEAGLEAEYNKYLSGKNGAVTYTQDALGFPIPTSIHETAPAQPGDSIETTIDPVIQGFVENEMNKLDTKYKPAHAAIIVTNPKTGAILAMSSRPTYNPNNYDTASAEALNSNWALSAFEPGSTFKPIVLAAALAVKAITLNQTVMSGHINVDGTNIHDWNYVGWGLITFQKALEMSSNVGFATIAERLGWSNLLHYLHDFGLLQKTGVDLPGESSSIIFPPSERGPVQLATSGFGQGIAVTPLQQLTAIGAIANGGNLLKPYLTKAILSPDGKVMKTFQPTIVRSNFLPQNVISEVNQSLVLDVTKGIDSTAAIKGYDVAGKTGTAQVANPITGQYYNNRFIVSFIGYAPAENPVVEVYVTVDWPKAPAANTWGSTISTPIARNIMQDCLEYYHVPPNKNAVSLPQATQGTKWTLTRYVKVPSLIGDTTKTAISALDKLGLKVDVAGLGGAVSQQWPSAGIKVSVGTRVYPLMSVRKLSTISMPNLTGMSMREAGNLLSALGLKINPIGSGYAVRQSVTPGKSVSTGTTIIVQFGT